MKKNSLTIKILNCRKFKYYFFLKKQQELFLFNFFTWQFLINKSNSGLYFKNIILNLIKKVKIYKKAHPWKYKFYKFNFLGLIKLAGGGALIPFIIYFPFFLKFSKMIYIITQMSPSDILMGIENIGWKKVAVFGTCIFIGGGLTYLNIDKLLEIYNDLFKKTSQSLENDDDQGKPINNYIWNGFEKWNADFNKFKWNLQTRARSEIAFKQDHTAVTFLENKIVDERAAITQAWANAEANGKLIAEANAQETRDLLAQQNARNLAKAEYIEKITKNAKIIKEEYIKKECIKLAAEASRELVMTEERADEYLVREAQIWAKAHSLEQNLISSKKWGLENIEGFAQNRGYNYTSPEDLKNIIKNNRAEVNEYFTEKHTKVNKELANSLREQLDASSKSKN